MGKWKPSPKGDRTQQKGRKVDVNLGQTTSVVGQGGIGEKVGIDKGPMLQRTCSHLWEYHNKQNKTNPCTEGIK